MRCLSLSLTNFRNYGSLALELSPGISVMHGRNASGKTTLLEAFHLLATMRSHRAFSDRETIGWGQGADSGSLPFARATTQVERQSGLYRIDVALSMEQREVGQPPVFHKRLRVNGAPKRGIDAVGVLNVVLFSPEDIALVTGSPSLRRRYLDILISQIDARYIRTLQHYNKVLLQRNNLLKHLRDKHRDIDPNEVKRELSFWTAELARAGGYLVARRTQITSGLSHNARSIFNELSGGGDPVCITYTSGLQQGPNSSLSALASGGSGTLQAATEETEDQLAQGLDSLRQKEVSMGMTLIGPHRDDVEFLLGGVSLGTYGSRGQQRAVVLALKLAESAVMHLETGEQPVLLLDDILSELDGDRRRYVLKVISGRTQQCFITTSDIGQFDAEFLGRAATIEILNGRVGPRSSPASAP